jgi:dienelactone hydrolase
MIRNGLTMMAFWWLSVGDCGAELRQGSFHSPEQAKAEMASRWEQYGTRAGWEHRAKEIRQGILEGAGLWPLPEREAPVVHRHSMREMGSYRVESVSIETAPGFHVAGNLYLPVETTKMPVVLSSHGHWPAEDPLGHGRFLESMQQRCATLAMMGCAVIAWDMVGHGESALMGWKHNVSPDELRLQLWNSIRVLDFMLTLPGADPERVAVTGESGGATQAFLLAAVDERVDMSVPCVQVSAWFYGGCSCESGLPIHVRPGHVANNVEIAAVIAPKPLLLLSNGKDWTRNVPELEFPHLKKIYRLFGTEDAVANAHFPDEGHDYGPSKRNALYSFLAEKFGLERELDNEAKVKILSGKELRAFDEVHPVPKGVCEPNSKIRLF